MQGAFNDVAPMSGKQVYPKTKKRGKAENLVVAEALEEQEVTGDRGTPDPEVRERKRRGP